MDKHTFRTAFSGFDKKEVMSYLDSLEAQTKSDVDGLNKKIAELEALAAKQNSQLKSKNKEIEKLLDELDTARKMASGKLGEMSGLVEEMGESEIALRKDFDAREAEYKEQILKLENEIEAGRATFARGRSVLEDAKAKAAKMIDDAAVRCEDMKDAGAKEAAAYKEQEINKVNEEIELRRNDVRAAEKKLQELLAAVDDTKKRLSDECDRVKFALKQLV